MIRVYSLILGLGLIALVTGASRAQSGYTVQTVLKLQSSRSGPGATLPGAPPGAPEPTSVRLESARVDLQGRVTSDCGASLAVPRRCSCQ